MKVLVVSDTHGSLSAWERVENFTDVDSIFHLGDVLYHGPRNPLPDGYDPKSLAEVLKGLDITYVRGNCDADVDLMVLGLDDMPKLRIVKMYGWKLALTHGDIIDDFERFADQVDADVVLYGHTHVLNIERVGKTTFINPGSPSLPKGGNPPSIAILDIEGDSIGVSIIDLEGKVLKEGRIER